MVTVVSRLFLPFSSVVTINRAVDYLSRLLHMIFQVLEMVRIQNILFPNIDHKNIFIIYLNYAQQHRQVLL